MSQPHRTSHSHQTDLPLGVVVGTDRYARTVTTLLRTCMPTECDVAAFPSVDDAVAATEGSPVAFLVVTVGVDTFTGDNLLRPVAGLPSFRNTRFMVLSTLQEVDGMEWLIDAARLDWIGYAPELQAEAFLENIRAQLTRYRERTSPDVRQLATYSVFDSPLTDEEIMEKILRRIERLLGRQPRLRIPEGTQLTIKGEWVEEVTIILRGSVALIHESPHGDIIMHEESTGRIIGLLAASEGRRAFLRAVATSEVVGVRLTVEQLNSAIQGNPEISLLVATLFIRFLDRRLRRAELLHIENVELSNELAKQKARLAAERAELATALSNLEEARTELMAQERLASLGALAAGMAHELNNPVAAIQRISEYLGEDVTHLLSNVPDSTWGTNALKALNSGFTAQSLSTRAERQLRRELANVTKDPVVAQRLVLAGIHDTELATHLRRRGGISLESAEKAASIGTQLRNLRSASARITDLVSSLRSYARPDGDPVTDVDLHENLDDAIRLLSHKLHGITVERRYEDLPPIECHPGQLAQVWTNLLTNAAEAITEEAEKPVNAGGEAGGASTNVRIQKPGASPAPGMSPTSGGYVVGTIKIHTSEPFPGWIRVEITDDGPGIPEDILPRIFEPRFTTKSGQVRFGMGIGMGVARSIVGKHHGTIRITSGPSGSTVTVELPVRAPQEEE